MQVNSLNPAEMIMAADLQTGAFFQPGPLAPANDFFRFLMRGAFLAFKCEEIVACIDQMYVGTFVTNFQYSLALAQGGAACDAAAAMARKAMPRQLCRSGCTADSDAAAAVWALRSSGSLLVWPMLRVYATAWRKLRRKL